MLGPSIALECRYVLGKIWMAADPHEVLKATAEPMAAREARARIAGELAVIQARPWWRRLIGEPATPRFGSACRRLRGKGIGQG
jgi:hypothetical protein